MSSEVVRDAKFVLLRSSFLLAAWARSVDMPFLRKSTQERVAVLLWACCDMLHAEHELARDVIGEKKKN